MRNWLVALLTVVSAACQAPGTRAGQGAAPGVGGGLSHGAGSEVAVRSLRDSVEPLRETFNQRVGQPRVVVLLSSTEGPCTLGARAVRESVLESYPDADLWVGIVWIDMQPSDCARSVDLAARRFVDGRVEHFHDPDKRAGRAFAVGLLPTGVAWDVYLFYPPGARWEDDPPRPFTWSHQLGRIDPEHFHPRELLFEKLHAATGELLSVENPPARETAPSWTEPPESTRWAALDARGD